MAKRNRGKSYSLEEVAEMYQILPRTVVDWTKLMINPLPYEKVLINRGGTWKYVFYEDQIRKWMNNLNYIREKEKKKKEKEKNKQAKLNVIGGRKNDEK